MSPQENEKKEGNLISVVKTLKDLISYQEGAVISRTIINQNTGTVTIFAFDEGEGLSEHVAPFDAMVEVLDGKVDIIIAGKSHLVEKGQMIIMPHDVPHALTAVEKMKMLLIMIRS
jgi:quercetin dioxygenase-like cupin family protein